MDRIVARYVLVRANAYSKVRQQAARVVRSRYSTALRTVRKGDRRLPSPYQPAFRDKYGRVYERPQLASESLRFRLLTNTINEDLSLSVEDLRAWVEDFLRLSSLKLLEGSDCNEVSHALVQMKVNYHTLTPIIIRWFVPCIILTGNIEQKRIEGSERRYKSW